MPKIDEKRGKNEKCSFCYQRVVNGKQTICSETCPTYAISFGERKELLKLGLKKVGELKSKGNAKANLYGVEETGILYVLADDPATYGLPAPGTTMAAFGFRALTGPLEEALALIRAIGGTAWAQ